MAECGERCRVFLFVEFEFVDGFVDDEGCALFGGQMQHVLPLLGRHRGARRVVVVGYEVGEHG